MPRAADPLQATRDRGWALDLDHEIDRPHVDAQLETAGGDEGRQPAGLELLLDLEPLLPGDAAVVGPDQLLAGELVEPLGEPLRQPAAVGEHDRAPVLADQRQDPRVDRRPDAGPCLAADRRAGRPLVRRQDLAQARHVLDRDDDLEVERLAGAGVDDRDLTPLADAAQVAGDRLERALGGGQADPLEGPRRGSLAVATRRAQPLHPLEAEREVRAALAARDGVDLVDDHLLDIAEDLACLAGEQQVQALRRGHQDVRRVADEVTPGVRGRVAGARGDRDPRRLQAQPPGREGDPGQGCPQVPLDVVGEGLERRDVQHPDRTRLAARRSRSWVRRDPVQAPQERGQGLAAAGGSVDQRVLAAGDRGPAPGLSVGRGLERRLEPGPDGGPERCERIGGGHGHGARV